MREVRKSEFKKMKKLIIILLVLAIPETLLRGQNNVSGAYRNYFGSKLILNSDSTYKYTYAFDLFSSWSTGKWILTKDTILLTNIVVFDTITTHCVYENGEKKFYDKKPELIISLDEKPEAISDLDARLSTICGGAQNKYPQPMKLFYENNKLYEIRTNGKLKRKKMKGFMSREKFDPYYIRE